MTKPISELVVICVFLAGATPLFAQPRDGSVELRVDATLDWFAKIRYSAPHPKWKSDCKELSDRGMTALVLLALLENDGREGGEGAVRAVSEGLLWLLLSEQDDDDESTPLVDIALMSLAYLQAIEDPWPFGVERQARAALETLEKRIDGDSSVEAIGLAVFSALEARDQRLRDIAESHDERLVDLLSPEALAKRTAEDRRLAEIIRKAARLDSEGSPANDSRRPEEARSTFDPKKPFFESLFLALAPSGPAPETWILPDGTPLVDAREEDGSFQPVEAPYGRLAATVLWALMCKETPPPDRGPVRSRHSRPFPSGRQILLHLGDEWCYSGERFLVTQVEMKGVSGPATGHRFGVFTQRMRDDETGLAPLVGSIQHVPEGSYEVRLGRPFLRVEADVDASNRLEIFVPAPIRMKVRLKHPTTGEVAKETTVSWVRLDDSGQDVFGSNGSVSTSDPETGEFTICALPGTFRIEAQTDSMYVREVVEIEGGESVDLVGKPTYRFFVRVVEDGVAFSFWDRWGEDIEFRLDPVGSGGRLFWSYATKDGNLGLIVDQPGTYSLEIQLPGAERVVSETIRVSERTVGSIHVIEISE